MQAKPLTEDIFENFTIIMDKNKINHHTPLPHFSELRKMNLPGFRKYYSEEWNKIQILESQKLFPCQID